MAQLSAVVVIALAGVAGGPGPAGSGLVYVLLMLCSAPYLGPLQAAVVGAGCSAGHLASLVVHGPGPGLAQRWLTLAGTLAAVVLMAAAAGGDRPVLQDLVRLEVTDAATGLPTGRYLEQLGRHVAARSAGDAPVAVVVVRVERFDEFTREYGPDLADAALERLGRRLRGALRAGDELLEDARAAAQGQADGGYVGGYVGAPAAGGPVAASLGMRNHSRG